MGTGEGGGRRRRKLEGADGDDSDEEYVLEEEEDEEEVDELECGRGGRDAASSSAGEEGGGSDAEYEVDDEEEEEEETPRPKRPVKRKANPAPARSRRRRYEDDDDYSEELEEDEEDLDGEEDPRRPNCATKCGGRGQKAKMPPVAQRSNRPRHAEKEDMDFDPDLDEGEGDEDTDFDPDLEGDDDEFEDDQEEELGVSHTRTIPRLKNTVRRNSASKQRRGKKKNSNTSRVSKRKVRKPALGRRRRKRSVIERYEDDDDDFIVEDDQVKVNRNSRKKARFARQVEVDRPVPVAEADIWPAIDSDSSEFEFGTSEDEPEGEPVRAAVRKGRKKRGVSGSSSDSEFHVSDKELSDVREEEVKMKKRVRVLQSSSDSEFHLSDKEMSDVREEEVKMKKRVRVLQSSSDSEFHLSDKEMSDVKEEEVKRKKRTCVLHSSSESEFHASDKELGDIRIEEARRKKRLLVPQSSSDSEFHVSDKDVRDSGEAKSLVAQPMLSVSPGRLSFTRDGGDKGKEKNELVDAGKPWCGICLSEDQRMTLQGVLNCCSHYFCFACIMEWSKVESRCPLCKRRFNTITKCSKVGLGLELKKSVIKVEERDQVYQPTEEEIRRWLDPYENLVCIECNQGGDDSLMLLCDICDSSAHTYCVGLGREVPEGNWYCGGCRLSGEGSMHPRRLTNSNSAQLGTTAPISTFGRSPSINPWQTFQGFDLNVSPRDIPRQNIHADSRASTLGVSTPTGRLATLSRRRGLMHILLDRQRQLVSQDTGHDGAQHSGYAPRADPDHRNFCASSESHSLQHNDSLPRIEPNRRNFSGPWEANSSQTLLDDIRDQHSCFSSVQAQRNSTPCLFVDGNNFQQTESVNSNVKHMCSISPH